MTKTIEEILGLGPFSGERAVPGSILIGGREHWYIEDDGSGNFDTLFLRVVTAVEPPFHTNGGALTGGCELTLPDGRRFHAMSYKGDLEGWRKQISHGAAKLNIAAAQAINGALVFPKGSVIAISSCQARFY